jgi:hypothetical protein
VTVGRSHRQAGFGAVLALMLGVGCVGPRSALRVEVLPVQTEVGTFRLEYPPARQRGADMIRTALQNAGPRLERWGRLQEPVTVRIHPSHKALEKAAQRSAYEWLRACPQLTSVLRRLEISGS